MINKETQAEMEGLIFDIQRYSTEDGPGIRTTVFFKGCPLRCQWCSNPESWLHKPQLMYFDKICVQCYACLGVCPMGANQKLDDGLVWVDRDLCKACGACVTACAYDARSISGEWMTADEVLSIIEKDSVYYMNSGGGVTFGGGECAFQPEFLRELVGKCYDKGYHICLDTSGFGSWDTLEKILPKVDLILMDIKHMDPAKHKEFTGVDNQLILENLARIKQRDKEVVVRLPLIPGCNDDRENIRATGGFMKLWGLDKIEIIPYHRLGVNKYPALGKDYLQKNTPTPEKTNVDEAVHILGSYGLKVKVV